MGAPVNSQRAAAATALPGAAGVALLAEPRGNVIGLIDCSGDPARARPVAPP